MKLKKMKLKRGHKLSIKTITDAVGFTITARVRKGHEAAEAAFSWSPVTGWYYEGADIGYVSWGRMVSRGPAEATDDRSHMATAFSGRGMFGVFTALEELL